MGKDRDPAVRIADRLLMAQARRETFEPVALDGKPIGLSLAYAAQRHLVRALSGHGGGIAGYKVGLTSPAIWPACGVNEPIAGVLLSGRTSRGPATVTLESFGRLGVECELAVTLRQSLPSGPARHDIGAIWECIDEIHAAFELIDDRRADYGRLDVPSLVAENVWNAGAVLGGPAVPIEAEALGNLAGYLMINGERVASGSTADVLGHPLNVVGWLADHLELQGETLKPGQIVMTGAIVGPKFAAAGDKFEFVIDGLPHVRLDLEEPPKL